MRILPPLNNLIPLISLSFVDLQEQIGKTAQKVVIDLKNKVHKTDQSGSLAFTSARNSKVEEALAALLMLGFSKNEAEKGIMKIKQQNPEYSVEELVKQTLKIL